MGVSVHAPDSKGQGFYPNCLSPCLFTAVITAIMPPSIPPIIITVETKTSLAVVIEYKDCSFLELKLSPWEKKNNISSSQPASSNLYWSHFHIPVHEVLKTSPRSTGTHCQVVFPLHFKDAVSGWEVLCLVDQCLSSHLCLAQSRFSTHCDWTAFGCHGFRRTHSQTRSPNCYPFPSHHVLPFCSRYGPWEEQPHWGVTASCNGGKLFLRPAFPSDDWGKSTSCVH